MQMRRKQFDSNSVKRNECNQPSYGCIYGYQNNMPKNKIIVGCSPQQKASNLTLQPVKKIKEKAKSIIFFLITRLQMVRCSFYIYDAFGRRKKYYVIAIIPMWSMKEEKEYIVYSDGQRDRAENLNLDVAIFDANAPKGQQLVPITDLAEKERLDWIISELKDSNGELINRLKFPRDHSRCLFR